MSKTIAVDIDATGTADKAVDVAFDLVDATLAPHLERARACGS